MADEIQRTKMLCTKLDRVCTASPWQSMLFGYGTASERDCVEIMPVIYGFPTADKSGRLRIIYALHQPAN